MGHVALVAGAVPTVVVAVGFGDVLKVLVALVAAVVLYLIGAFFVRSFTLVPPPPSEPPDPSELTPVHYEYQCVVCGAAVTMTAAPTEDPPDPPRHCREDMRLVSDIGELPSR